MGGGIKNIRSEVEMHGEYCIGYMFYVNLFCVCYISTDKRKSEKKVSITIV